MTDDLIVKDAQIVIPELGILRGHLVVADGKVRKLLSADEPAPKAERVIEAEGRYVMPGAIDAHCHYGLMPPISERMAPETASAALGGVTTLVRYFRRTDSYLDTLPPHIVEDAAYHYQDFSVHLALFNQQQVTELPSYVHDLGVTSFKLYMNLKAPLARGFLIDPLVDDTEAQMQDLDYSDGLLFSIVRALAALRVQARLSVHVEEADLISHQTELVKASGMGGLIAWHHARPEEAEALGIHKVSYLSRRYGVPVYFPHIGSALGVQALEEEAALGTNMVAETCPHYLVHNVLSSPGVLLKVMPPVRTEEDNRATWSGIEKGLITTVCTDHIPYTLNEKRVGDIWSTRPAFGSIGVMVPVILSYGINTGRLSVLHAAKLLSTNAARAFHLYPQKGTLLPGSDADFFIPDMDHRWSVHAGDLASAQDFSVYEGMELTARVDTTVSRGEVIVQAGQLQTAPGRGKFIRRSPAYALV